MKKVDEAIDVFNLNAQMYPQSSNVYDSLGEAYMKKGNKELAIKNYEKSTVLDPANTDAIKILKELTRKEDDA
ncbi:MAG TPA: tetratricopeptide repeat protein [Pyrinomonadaceae bacterium]|nr:tetratricopeptide repeat protein [Pyrinomonadaceae bacterium]